MTCRTAIRRSASILLGISLCGCAHDASSAATERLGHPTSGAAAWKIADDVVAPAADTVAAIDIAKLVSQANLSNAETTAFKAARCRVNDNHPAMYLDMSQGSLEHTGRDLDVAIQGKGFFRVKVDPNLGDGYAYTRNGNFFRNDQGDMVLGMGNGYRLDPPISIPQDTTQISISDSGVIQVLVAGQIIKQTIGQINLYEFANAEGLNSLTSNLYQSNDSSGQAIELKPKDQSAGSLQQNFLESSNVDVTREQSRIEFLDKWRAAVLR